MDPTVEKYLDAAGDAIVRARRVLLVTLGVSAAILMAYWNLFAGFSHERLRDYSAASYWLRTYDSRPNEGFLKAGDGIACAEDPRTRSYCRRARAAIYDVARHEGIPERLILSRIVEIRERVDDRLATLREDAGANLVSITTPLAGITVDIADLGFFAGLSTAALLALLALTVHAQIRDVEAATRAADRLGQGVAIRELISSKQVFTVTGGNGPIGSVLKYATIAFFSLPLFAETCGLALHVYYRLSTPGATPRSVVVDLVVPAVFWVLVLLLTYELFHLESRYKQGLAENA